MSFGLLALQKWAWYLKIIALIWDIAISFTLNLTISLIWTLFWSCEIIELLYFLTRRHHFGIKLKLL
jgi:hypothetical protein